MKPILTLLAALLLAPLTVPPAVEGAVQFTNRHVLELRERVLHPEDGLLLGNGDLSVSVYQDADRKATSVGSNKPFRPTRSSKRDSAASSRLGLPAAASIPLA